MRIMSVKNIKFEERYFFDVRTKANTKNRTRHNSINEN